MSEKLEPISEQPDLVFRLVFARAKEWPHQSTSVSGWAKCMLNCMMHAKNLKK